MTKAEIDDLFERVRGWPDERRTEAAEILLFLEARKTDVYVSSDEEERDLDEAEGEIARGEVASDEDVATVLAELRRA